MTTVLQIIPSMGAGGAEQATLDIAAGLVAAGHRALVVSSGGRLVGELERLGATHFTMPVNSKNPLKMIANARWLAKLIRSEQINILHARSRAPAWSAYWASQMTDCPFMTTFHAAYKFNSAIKKFYNSVMAKGDRIIAISEFIAAHIRTTYGVGDDVIRVILRSIDLDKYAPNKITLERQAALRSAWGLGSTEKVILMPARLSPIKGHKTLINAMAQLPETNHTKVVIVGDDQGRITYRYELEALIKQHKLQDRILLKSHCSDMPAAYSLACMVIAPSLVPEGFGRTPIEAMAMGVPAIASDLGGYRETIRPPENGHGNMGRNGWLFPVGDAEQLATCIWQVISLEPAQRATLTSRAQEEARRLYDKRKMVADTLAVYTEIAG